MVSILTKMLGNTLVKVVPSVLACIYFNLPVTQTEIAFVRGLLASIKCLMTHDLLSGERDHGPPLQYAKAACGDLCDSSRPHVPWNFLNYTVAEVRKARRKSKF